MHATDWTPEMLHELGDALEIGIVTTDADLVVRSWNRWLEVASGLGSGEVVGLPLLGVFPEIAGGQREAAFRRALAGETVVLAHRFHRFLLPLPVRAGAAGFEQMQQSARILPLVCDGRVEGTIAIVQDVTERVAREEELRLALERAEAASQAKSDFLATTSHELRTPLTAVIGYSDLLESEVAGPVGQRQREFLNRIRASTWHLLSLIDEILTFSRIEAGKEEVDAEPCDVLQLAREAILLVEPQAIGKGLSVSLSLPDGPVTIRSDARKIRQILLNLLGNAVKFTDAGTIELELTESPDRVVFQVRDTGVGIRAADLERVFEPFTQVDQSATRRHAGTGLGLPVSRRLARLLGGDLLVESVPGEGSTFTLWVPLERAAARVDAGTGK